MKKIVKLAWRNIWRNWRRTLLTSLAIAFAVISVLFAKCYIEGIIEDIYDSLTRNEIGHIKIASKEFLRMERVLPREHLVFNTQDLEESLFSIQDITSATERIRFHLILSHEDKNEPAVGIGINPEKERDFSNLEKYIIQGNYVSRSSQGMVIGAQLAQKLEVQVGDELLVVTTDINFSTYALTFKVAGIFKTGMSIMDKGIFYIPIAKAQELLDCHGAAHEILLLVKDYTEAARIAGNVQKILEEKKFDGELAVIPWQEHWMVKYMPVASQIFNSILFIIMLIAALVILNTMLMAVLERTHEIGIIKSMGMRDRAVIGLILVESILIGIIGVLIGGAVGSSLALYTQKTGLDFSEMFSKVEMPLIFSPVVHPKFTLWILGASVGFALLATIIAALYPAIKAARLSPVEALRSSLK